MLTCREVTELATDYDERRLRLFAAMGVRVHIAMCVHCRLYLRQLRALVRAAPAVPSPSAPLHLVEALAAQFAALPPRAEPLRARVIRLFGGFGGALVAMLIVGAFAFRSLWFGVPGLAVGPWLACIGMQLVVGAVTLAIGAHLLQSRAGAGGWAACAALGAGMSSAALAFMCPVEPTTAHLLVVHTGGVALAAVLAASARVAIPVGRRV